MNTRFHNDVERVRVVKGNILIFIFFNFYIYLFLVKLLIYM